METEINEFVEAHYDISAGQISRLEGYGSENYRVETKVGRSFVLKFYRPNDVENLQQLLEAENQLLMTLTADNHNGYPIPQADSDGRLLSFSKQKNRYYRLLSFVEGRLLCEVDHTPELLGSFGIFLGEMNSRMLGFRHLATEAREFEWDLKNLELNRKYIRLIENPSHRKIVEYFFLQYSELVTPNLEQLRKCVIHGDANDWNVLTSEGLVSGIIDFADIVYSPLINDLAIAVTYAIFDKADVIEPALSIISGYHSVLPLRELEVKLLYYLIAARASITVCHAAKSKADGLTEDYIYISANPAVELLEKWIRINPSFFENEVSRALGFEPKLNNGTVESDLAKRHKTTSRALSLQFTKPIKMIGAAFQFMYDSTGKSYLDCYNNIPQVGHCHPRVVNAGQRAMAKLNTNTRYLSDVYNEYSENLLARFPDSLSKVFFVNSGSAASDLAIRLAAAHTGRAGIVVIEHGYHGNTRLGIDISHYKYNRKGGHGKNPSIVEAAVPDTYKGKFYDENAGNQFGRELIDQLCSSEIEVAAFIAEPIVGCGGQIPLPAGYLKRVYPFIREIGGVCISDEVQTGFGRLGRYFWGFEMHGVEPDIVVLGKPMGNGHPIAAVVTSDAIAESFETGMEFFSSFGGNPVSCAIGQAVLDVLSDEDLPKNAEDVGRHLKRLLKDLVEKYEVCGDARGEGLFLGLELVIDKGSKKPNTELASFLQNELKERGILVGTDGPFENVLKIKPPICFSVENAEELVSNIKQILEGLDG